MSPSACGSASGEGSACPGVDAMVQGIGRRRLQEPPDGQPHEKQRRGQDPGLPGDPPRDNVGRGSSVRARSRSSSATSTKWPRVGGACRDGRLLLRGSRLGLGPPRSHAIGRPARLASMGRLPSGRSGVGAGGRSLAATSRRTSDRPPDGSSRRNQPESATAVSELADRDCSIVSSRRPRMLALGIRRPGSFSKSWARMRSSSSGASGACLRSGSGCSNRCLCSISGSDLPRNTGRRANSDVHQRAQAVQIGPAVDRPSFGLLRGHVFRRSQHVAGAGQTRIAKQPRDAEVGQFHAAVGHHQQVARLDVAVDDRRGRGRGARRGRCRCRSASPRASRNAAPAAIPPPGCCRRPVPWHSTTARPARRSRTVARCSGWLSLRRVSISASKRMRNPSSWANAGESNFRAAGSPVSRWTPS